MLYSSRNGCFFYYDSVLFSWKIAEPTLLFLLGLESVTSYNNSQSDCITISKYVYNKLTDSLESLEHISDIYDDIYSFLSTLGSVEDFEQYLNFNCYGLKLLMNKLTGTGNDRTVPVIFKSGINRSLVDVSSEYSSSNLSYNDLQANKIYSLFNNIGYDTDLYNPENNTTIAEYRIDKSSQSIISQLSLLDSDKRKQLLKDINVYNSNIDDIHNKRIADSEIYKLLDYKAMYAYALGVLYGCRCLGYNDSVVWRLDPKYWYTDTYYNLVRTAWHVFRFHWTTEIKDIANSNSSLSGQAAFENKYKGIQNNKLWNFTNSAGDLGGESLAKDETPCFCMYLSDNRNTSNQILYSQSTGDFPGSYLVNSSNIDKLSWRWVSVYGDSDDNYVVSKDSSGIEKGIISAKDTVLVRYIGNDPVYIYRAYSPSYNMYLAPMTDYNRYKKYYVYTGHLGWIDYDESILIDIVDSPTNQSNMVESLTHNYLYIAPKSVERNILKYAIKNSDGKNNHPEVVTYYECYFPKWDSRTYSYNSCEPLLYGIYNKYIDKQKDSIPTNFDRILSNKLFSSEYTITDKNPNNLGYSSKEFFDLSSVVYLYVTKKEDEDNSTFYIYTGDSIDIGIPISEYGYSETPSSEIKLYTTSDNEIPDSISFRYNKDYNQYWHESFFNTQQTRQSQYRTWHNKSDITSAGDFYISENKSLNLYVGEFKLLSKPTLIYNKFDLEDTNAHHFVYINKTTPYSLKESINDIDYNINYDFIEVGGYSEDINDYVDTLYYRGITTNLCQFILTDDFGNSLIDEDGNALVWYDPKYNVYWNGLLGINRWQKTKPTMNSTSMFSTYNNSTSPVYINENLISIDGNEAITLDEFYSDTTRGIIRDTLQVFNPSKAEGIITCYCDTKLSDNQDDYIYCIPNVSKVWDKRSSISELGYWFVDGVKVLYSGDSSEEVVFDDDHTD